MKQMILGLVACALLSSCNNSSESETKKDSSQVSNMAVEDTALANFPHLSDTAAQLMIYHFLSSEKVSHTKETEIQRIEFDAPVLEKLFSDHKTQRLRLFTAAYLDSDPDSLKRNTKTIILQLKSANKLSYYDIYAIGLPGTNSAQPICPPPTGTCDLNFSSSLEMVKASLNN
jgi:hypothetical protein